MIPVGQRLYDECKTSLFYAPLMISGGALFGYVYAALADLPAHQAAKAWAVWSVAELIILSLGSALAETDANRMLIKATLFTFTTVIGINELRRQKLMGDRLMSAAILMRALIIFALLTSAAVSMRRSKAQTPQTSA